MPKVSVIVPVYRVEKYIVACIQSVIQQTFQEWELILVDDGSPDKSGEICDAWSRKDNRIRVFHKENGGVSSARNLGIKKASGKWITFIDSDDIVAPTFLEGLLEPTLHDNEIDFVQGGFSNYHNGKVTSVERQYDRIVSEDMAYVFNNFRGYVFSKLFLTENVKDRSNGIGLLFDTKMKFAEDMAFTLDYLLTINKYAFVPEVGYYYRRDNECSATKQISAQDYTQKLHTWKHIYSAYSSYITKNKIDVNNIRYRQSFIAETLMIAVLALPQTPYSFFEKIKRLRDDFSDKEFDLLSNAFMTFTRKRIVLCLRNQKYKSAYFLIVLNKYESYFLRILYRIMNFRFNSI